MIATRANRMKMIEKDVSIFLFFFGCAVVSDMTATPFGARRP